MDNSPYNEDQDRPSSDPELEKKERIEEDSGQRMQEENASFVDDIFSAIGIPKLGRRRTKEPDTEKPSKEPSAEDKSVAFPQKQEAFEEEIEIEDEDVTPLKTAMTSLSVDTETSTEQSDVLSEPKRKIWFKPKTIISLLLVACFATASYVYVPILMEPRPPGEDVVATYNGKNITTADLMEFMRLEGVREGEHAICDKHGMDHSKCDEFEECETHPVHSMEAYQQIVEIVAFQQIVLDWADKNGITQREDVEHGLKDLVKDTKLESYVDKMHEEKLTPESIPKWEVQQYYDENKATYGDKAFSDVENEIREILVAQKDETFFPEYIEELKKTAGLNVNLEILKVDDPADEELLNYYQQNAEQFTSSSKVTIEEFPVNGDTGSEEAMNNARDALSKLRAGDTLENVLKKYAADASVANVSVTKGERGESFDKVIFDLIPDEYSEPYEYGGKVYIAKFIKKEESQKQSFNEAKQEIKTIVSKEKMDKQYELKKSEALFTVHGRRYTLGEFVVEYNELPAEYQTAFSGYEGKKQLVEQMIAKELLLEEYGDESQNEDEKHRIEDIKQAYLNQVLHEEEIDAKLGDVSEEEIRAFFEENKDRLIDPAKVKLSLIWIDEGMNGEKGEQANTKATEALNSINSGTDFAEVAKLYSEDFTAQSGGAIDEWIHLDELPGDMSIAISKLKNNEVSPIVKSNGGLYIFKVKEIEPKKQQSFEDAKVSIEHYLSEERHEEMQANLQKNLLEESNLVVYDRTLRQILKAYKQNN